MGWLKKLKKKAKKIKGLSSIGKNLLKGLDGAGDVLKFLPPPVGTIASGVDTLIDKAQSSPLGQAASAVSKVSKKSKKNKKSAAIVQAVEPAEAMALSPRELKKLRRNKIRAAKKIARANDYAAYMG